jgi:hypothetical protein
MGVSATGIKTTKTKGIAMTFEEKVAKCLLDARELMNNGGKHWTRGAFKRRLDKDEYAYCSIGAIRAVTTSKDQKIRNEAYRQLATMIYAGPETRNVRVAQGRIVQWNDMKATWGDVSRTFRQAAKRAAKQPS